MADELKPWEKASQKIDTNDVKPWEKASQKKSPIQNELDNTSTSGKPILPSAGLTDLSSLTSGGNEIPTPLTEQGKQPYIQEQKAKAKKAKTFSDQLNSYKEAYKSGKSKTDIQAVEKQNLAPSNLNDTLAQKKSEDSNGAVNFGKYLYNKVLQGSGSAINGLIDLSVQNVALGGNIGYGSTNFQAEDTNATIKEYRQNIAPQVRGFLKEQMGADLDKGKERKFDEGFITGAVGGLLYSAPAMATPYGIGMFSQSYDTGLESINSTEKGKNLTEAQKTLFAGSVGAVTGALEKFGLDKIMGKGGSKVANTILLDSFDSLIKSGTKKITQEALETAINAEVKSLSKKLLRGGTELAEHAISGAKIEGLTGGLQELGTAGIERLTNYLTDDKIFDEESMGELAGRVLKAGAQEAIGGGLLGGAVGGISGFNSDVDTDLIKRISDARTFDEQRNALLDIENVAKENGLDEESTAQIINRANEIIELNKTLPSAMTAEEKQAVIPIIEERNAVQEEIDRSTEALPTIDEAFKKEEEARIKILEERKSALNDFISDPETIDLKPKKNEQGNETVPTKEEAQPIKEQPTAEQISGETNIKVEPEQTSKNKFDLYHTGDSGLTIEDISVDPRKTRQGRKGNYGGFYAYDNIEDVNKFSKGNNTKSTYGINLKEGVKITEYDGSIERLDADKLQELRDKGIKVIKGKSLLGKIEIIVIDKSAIKSIESINGTKQNNLEIDNSSLPKAPENYDIVTEPKNNNKPEQLTTAEETINTPTEQVTETEQIAEPVTDSTINNQTEQELTTNTQDNATQKRNIQQSSITEREGTTEQQQGQQENRLNQEEPISEGKTGTGSSNQLKESRSEQEVTPNVSKKQDKIDTTETRVEPIDMTPERIKEIQVKRDTIKQSIKDKLKAQRGNLSSGFDPSLIKDLVELGATYAEEGIVRAEDFIKRFREDYKDVFGDDKDITDEQIKSEVFDKVNPESIAKEEGLQKRRSATQRVLKSKEYSEEFKSALSDNAIYYKELPNSITEKEAEAFIAIKGMAEAEIAISDFNNGMKSAVRFSVMQKLIDMYEANGEYLKAAEVAEELYSKATDYGQGIQVFSTFPKLSKRSQVALAQKNIDVQRRKQIKQSEKTTKKLTNEVQKANKESAEETIEAVKKTIEKQTKIETGKITDLPSGYGTKNKVFTRDKYLKSKQKLRGISMSFAGGLPIEDLVNIAGYHIEATGRDFNKFSRRMKADLGAKIKPYLKDIYAQTRQTLINENYDESLFLTDDEIDAQINEQEGTVWKEKFEKTVEKGNKKEQSIAIKKLNDISKDEGLWGQYRDLAKSKLKSAIKGNWNSDTSTNPSLNKFTDGLVRNLRQKMKESMPASQNVKEAGRPDIQLLGDLVNNLDKYKDIWEKTQAEFKEEYKDNPQVLEDLDNYFGQLLDAPFSETVVGSAISKGLKEMDKNISNIVLQHYTVYDSVKQSLKDKLINDAGLTPSEATELSKAIEDKFDKIATAKKRQILERMFSKKERKKPEVRSLEDDIIRMSNLGGFRETDIVNSYAEKMGFAKLTENNIKEIERLSDLAQQAKDPIKKRRAVENLLSYQAKINGYTIGDLAVNVWYANVLSGFNTQEVNFVANAINTTLMYSNAILQRPNDAKFITKGLISGIKRGWLEAGETFYTGYSPIKGRAEIPTLLERETFKGGKFNPVNYLKYVRRIMVAADVIFFEGQKEMRAYQLASKESSREGKLEPTMNQRNRAIELIGKTDIQLQQIKNITDLEYENEVSEIKAKNLSKSDEYDELRQADRDRRRRVFDMIEQQRGADMIQETSEYASEGTYNYKPKGSLGAIAMGINQMVKDLPVLRYAVPFTNIIANVANETINYTPLGLVRTLRAEKGGALLSSFRREPLTDQQKVDLTTKAIIGTTLMASAFILSNTKGDDDEPYLEITAKGTGDYAKNYTLAETGWQQYSFRFKKPNGEYSDWYSYQYSPLIAVLGFVGHYNELIKYGKEDDDTIATRLSKAGGLTTTSFFEATFLDGLGSLMNNLLDPNRSQVLTDKGIKGALGAVKGVVIPNFITQTTQELERVFGVSKKEVRETMAGQILQDIPYARNIYYDKINILGDDIKYDLDKFQSKAKPNKIIQLLIDKKAVFAPINRKSENIYDIEEGEQRVLTDQEFYEYSKLKGQYIKKALESDYDKFSKMSDGQFKKELAKIKGDATKQARKEVAGVVMEDSKITIADETYVLTKEMIKERIKLRKEYISNNTDLLSVYTEDGKMDGLSVQQAKIDAEKKLSNKANAYATKELKLKYDLKSLPTE